MELSQLLPGSPVELTILYSDTSEDQEKSHPVKDEECYISSLFDVTKSGELIIHMPTRQSKLISLPMDVSYKLVVNTNVGLFSLEGVLVNMGKIEKFPVYIFSPTSDIKKVQRRDYFRFECMLPVIVHPISREIGLLPTNELIDKAILTEYDDVFNDVSATILDISGGGARFHARVDINTDSFMLLSFTIKSKDKDLPMKVVARRVKSSYKDDANIYEHRVEFIFKEKEDREVIIKYIFDEQRHLRKKKSEVKNV